MRLRSSWICGLTLLACTCLAAPAAAAEDWPVPRGPSREPVPYRYDPQQIKHAPRAFLEDSAACLLYSGTTYLIEADGNVETIIHEVTRLNGRKAVEALGEYRSITYDPAYQKLTLNEAHVIKPDGKIVEIEPRHVQLRDVATDFSVYEPDKQVVISLPNLEVNDVFEVKWTTRGKSPEYAGHYFSRYPFGDGTYPVLRDELRIRVPRERTLKFAPVNGKIEPVVREDGENKLYTWSAKDCPAPPQDSDLPSREELRVQLMFSTFPSWEEVGAWKQKLRAGCWKSTDAIRKTVAEVTRGLKTPLEKARALTYWVRRRIRYVSMATAHHGYTPHPPAHVIENLFGDCKDQAQLLAVMLREAKVPVALVTLGALDDGQIVPEVPSPWGSHAILLVQLDGKDHWIDTTCTQGSWDFLPRTDRDRVVYVTGESGIRVTRTPKLSAENNRSEHTTVVSIMPDGSAHYERTLRYEGAAALAQREAWIDVPPGERRRLMSADLQDANIRARLAALHVDERNLRDLDQPVQAKVEFDIPEQFSEAEHESSLSDSRVWNRLLALTTDYERQAPVELGSVFESVHRYIVQLPAVFRFDSLPKNRTIKSRWTSFNLVVRHDAKNPRRLEVEFRTRLEKSRVEPEELAEFRKFQQDLTKHWRAWITLTQTKDLADAPALEQQTALAPDDGPSALVLSKIYQRHNRLDDARRVLNRARTKCADDPAIWEMSVAVAGSLEQKEAIYREMVARFGDEPKYAVALGAICVKRGDQAAAAKVLEPLTRADDAVTRAQAYYQLARSALAAKNASAALAHLRAARAADRETAASSEALLFEGEVQERLGHADDAIRVFRKVLHESPDNPQVLLALIRLERSAKRPTEALDHLRRYTLAVGDDLEGLVQAADLHLQMGRLEDALELAERARGVGFHAGGQRVLGLVYLERGDFEKALLHLDRAGHDAQTLPGLIRANLALGKLQEALACAGMAGKLESVPPPLGEAFKQVLALANRKLTILQGLETAPKSADWMQAVDALVCAERAHADGASSERVAALLNRAFADGVEIGPAYALRGLRALERGLLGKALSDAERAIALSPGESLAYYVRGRVKQERGQKEAAVDLERAAALTQRKDAAVLHWLAAAQWESGRQEEALGTQRQAVALRPQDRDMLQQLRDFERRMVKK